jgi:ribosomal protein S18 acetylase RimI-like enzyme
MQKTGADSIQVAEATEAEREWCARLMAVLEPWLTLGRTMEQSRTILHNPEYQLFIAHTEGAPRGFLLVHRRGVAGSPYIASLAVAQEAQGRGIGSYLLEFAEELFRGGAKHIFLCVSSFNSRARSLYERCGYKVVGEFKDYVIEGASEILMHKRLS